MVKYLIPRIEHELLVLSDIHLLSKEDTRGKILLKFLSQIDTTKVRFLVLLGDIFDFCFGTHPYYHEKFSAFGTEFSRLAKNNVKVYFMEGNHEFCVEDLLWEGVSFVKEKDLQIQSSDGKSFMLCHGDYLNAPWHYRLYSEVIRSTLSKYCAYALPQTFLDALALKISASSRKRTYSQKVPHKKILSNCRNWLSKQKVDVGIVGHFHVPYNLMIDENTRLMGLNSWDKPNCLTYDKGKFYRIFLSETDFNIVEIEDPVRGFLNVD